MKTTFLTTALLLLSNGALANDCLAVTSLFDEVVRHQIREEDHNYVGTFEAETSEGIQQIAFELDGLISSARDRCENGDLLAVCDQESMLTLTLEDGSQVIAFIVGDLKQTADDPNVWTMEARGDIYTGRGRARHAVGRVHVSYTFYTHTATESDAAHEIRFSTLSARICDISAPVRRRLKDQRDQ